jgi:hypothetical protein
VKRPPFQLRPSRHATVRFTSVDGRVTHRGGRSTYVWAWYVLARRAAGIDGTYEIRLNEGTRATREARPWHLIDITQEEAEQALRDLGPFARGILRAALTTREARARSAS